MKNIGLFFGSFNPIHNGHLIIASSIINLKIVDEIWFIVSPQNPLKDENTLLDFNHRYNMIKLAIDGIPKFLVSDIETTLPIPSYTYQTIQKLKQDYIDYTFHIIMGQDCINGIYKWKNFEEILINKIIIYPRNKYPLIFHHDEHNLSDYPEFPIIDISSTIIRKLIQENKIYKYLIPNCIYEYIRLNNLYKLEN